MPAASLGADVVVHSVTKYLSGHSDVVLGATVVADTERGAGIGERLRRHRTLHGAIAGPMEVFLALRGLRTLSVRFERACASAAELARRLGGHPSVERVRYPGSGAMVSIDVVGEADAAERVCASTRLWLHATSLGGVESQLERRRRHPSESEQVPVNLLRLSVGIEHVDDLWADLAQALGRRLSRALRFPSESSGRVGHSPQVTLRSPSPPHLKDRLVSNLLDLSTALFLRVNDFARTSTWLHAPAVAYAKYGLVVFAALIVVGSGPDASDE